ncbi:Lrp/AsnC family transcriptional regulator [Carnimonas bestiolae]|uniref:Lrp/AsnC family transcriptional regulator n=1 Tax=Carnimonas bestiolae TaxID=3402172 RepID=UPI003EDC5FD9
MNLDHIDRRLLAELQRDSTRSQRELADLTGLSQNACWRRLQALKKSGIIDRYTAVVNRHRLGLNMTVFMMLKAGQYTALWHDHLCNIVSRTPEVVDFYRVGGSYDYCLKLVTQDMASFDATYRQITEHIELKDVVTHFVMETLEEQRPLPVKGR